ncbi:hypothetical protein HPC38_02315 [Pasteurellaceae bacterium HPA106]|uniref:hypothetical protein n=1 Tax=Spirabiliibacterium pneumoniae TaxID=221400 RepID=UPI001AAD2286|nr:hypothetical protein [Spirabiliibacterium pneumoniae]MBE2895713.1 hypothetical protein [Spirabiliibacterium pneumoniae]
MADYKVVTPENLNDKKGFDINQSEQKINVKVDNKTIGFDESGALKTLAEKLAAITNVRFENGGGTPKLVFTVNGGDDIEVPLTEIAKDINVEAAEYDPESTTLTLTRTESQAPVTVDLGKLAESAVEATETVTLSGTGKTDDPLKADVNLEALGNLMVADDGSITFEEGKAKLNKAVVFDTKITNAFGTQILGYISSTNS